MGVDESTGEILIVLANSTTTGDNYIKNDASDYYFLQGQTGYVNGVSELNNICSIFGEGYGASKARSMTIEDVDKLTGYDPETAEYGIGEIYAYRNKVTYTLTDSNLLYSGENGASGKYVPCKSFTFFNNGTWTSLNSGENTTLTCNYYYYTKSDYPSDLVYSIGANLVEITDTADYFLNSTYLSCTSQGAGWGFRKAGETTVGGSSCYNACTNSGTANAGVRPVVQLSTGVSLSGDSSLGWTIN